MSYPQDLPTTKPFTGALQSLVEGVNGFVYAGASLDTIMAAVRWLRAALDAAYWLFAPVGTRRLPIHQLDDAKPGDVLFFPEEGEGS